AGISKQVGEPSPPEGRLKGDRRGRGLRHHFAEHPQNVGSARRHLPIYQQLALATNRSHLRRLAVEVDTDVNHDQGLLPGGCLRGGHDKCRSLTPGAEAPLLLHGISWKWLKQFSLFTAYTPQKAIEGQIDVVALGVLVLITGLCTLGAIVAFERRDAV